MNTIPLEIFREGKTQTEVAQVLGCSQSAVSQMLSAKREVYIIQNADGSFDHFEKKPVGKRKSA